MRSSRVTPESLNPTLFREIVAKSPRPILVTNERVEIDYVNDAWKRQFGYTLSEVRGKNPRFLQSGLTPKGVYARMWVALKAGKSFETEEVVDQRKNGRLFSLFSTFFPVQVGSRKYYVQILDDITRRKKLQEYQSAFIKIAAHDIRSPLSAIRLTSDLLALKARGTPYEEMLIDIQSLQNQVARAGALVVNLLDISLFESGKIALKRERINVRALIDEVLAHARTIAPTQRFESSVGNVTLHADKERIRQVLVNIVENAIKYGSSRHPIGVTAATIDEMLRISVRDRGPGISKDAASRIFEPFYRTAYAKKKKISGHGLGLHIAHKIVQAHRGRIWIEPRSGGGSVFSFTIPRKKDLAKVK